MSLDDEEPDNDPCSFKNSNEGSCQRDGNSNEDALFFACERGHEDCLKQITTDSSRPSWFVSDVNIIMKTGWTPLTKACSKGQLKVVEWLLNNCNVMTYLLSFPGLDQVSNVCSVSIDVLVSKDGLKNLVNCLELSE